MKTIEFLFPTGHNFMAYYSREIDYIRVDNDDCLPCSKEEIKRLIKLHENEEFIEPKEGEFTYLGEESR